MHCEVDGVAIEVDVEHLRREGMFVPTPTPLPLDLEVEVRVRSALGEIAVRALVVQVIDARSAAADGRAPGYGVLFLDLRDDQRAFIGLTLSTEGLKATSKAPPVASVPAVVKSSPPPPRAVDDAVERARATRRKAGATATQRTTVLAALERVLCDVKQCSPWAALGVEPAQGIEAAHRAFLVFSKRYHPHVFARFDSPEVSRLATEIFIAYKRAYATVRAAARGAQLTEPLRAVSLAPPTEGAGATPSAQPPAPGAARRAISMPPELASKTNGPGAKPR